MRVDFYCLVEITGVAPLAARPSEQWVSTVQFA